MNLNVYVNDQQTTEEHFSSFLNEYIENNKQNQCIKVIIVNSVKDKRFVERFFYNQDSLYSKLIKMEDEFKLTLEDFHILDENRSSILRKDLDLLSKVKSKSKLFKEFESNLRLHVPEEELVLSPTFLSFSVHLRNLLLGPKKLKEISISELVDKKFHICNISASPNRTEYIKGFNIKGSFLGVL